jgi:hypothetical protein
MSTKIQFCCGEYRLTESLWQNYDSEKDISKPMGFANNSVDFIFIEHGIEHIDQMTGVAFLKQCFNMLKKNGVLRLTFPDVEKIFNDTRFQDTTAMLYKNKYSNAEGIKSVISGWDHKSFWSSGTMLAACFACGFIPYVAKYRQSIFPELCNLESHWKFITSLGLNAGIAQTIDAAETSSIEAIKIND